MLATGWTAASLRAVWPKSTQLWTASVHCRMAPRSFVDVAWIDVRAGDGGGGAATFGRGKNRRVGPPDGGDGGPGGCAYIVCDAQQHDLALGKNRFRAEHGTFGKSKKRDGRAGEDVWIQVPRGTLVRAFSSEHRAHLHKDASPLWTAELDEDGAELLVAKGGAGGLGNRTFVSGSHRSPLERVEGGKGEEFRLQLELKLIADIGLVGLPNAGKSSLLAALSRASPKIANYPFTTLTPNIGMVPLNSVALKYVSSLQQQEATVDCAMTQSVEGDEAQVWKPAQPRIVLDPRQLQLCIADIPGLVEGAHKNIGLGHSFLRHVERSAGLVYVLDAAGDRPWEELSILSQELEAYQPGLSSRCGLVVANKADLPNARENAGRLREVADAAGLRIVPASAKLGDNLSTVVKEMLRIREASQPHPFDPLTKC